MIRRIAAVLVSTAVLCACGGDATTTTAPETTTVTTAAPTTTAGASAAVEISGFAFHPADLMVTAGTTVTWTNSDGVTHTTTSDTGIWSASISAGTTKSVTFDTPGVFTYHCAIHQTMTATITVTP